MSEMHILAYVYHWEPDQLWGLSVRERRKWVEAILEQKKAESEALKSKTPSTPTSGKRPRKGW